MKCETERKIAPRAYQLLTLEFIHVEDRFFFISSSFFSQDEMMNWGLYTEITVLKVQPGKSTRSY
jgi:hypothetical protein